ncbi:kinase-like domain-containing protein [Jimgerdemannia flammicorona]|uniref:Kinase-like domain-containing protein n=1 Tax=Jimgerdemannia flammicorona TaxID=994334 RepID=A0A433DF08_9FUNG|nr:kinase-like domain-containing protein [Jimgerdemannia flammicorona]
MAAATFATPPSSNPHRNIIRIPVSLIKNTSTSAAVAKRKAVTAAVSLASVSTATTTMNDVAAAILPATGYNYNYRAPTGPLSSQSSSIAGNNADFAQHIPAIVPRIKLIVRPANGSSPATAFIAPSPPSKSSALKKRKRDGNNASAESSPSSAQAAIKTLPPVVPLKKRKLNDIRPQALSFSSVSTSPLMGSSSSFRMSTSSSSSSSSSSSTSTSRTSSMSIDLAPGSSTHPIRITSSDDENSTSPTIPISAVSMNYPVVHSSSSSPIELTSTAVSPQIQTALARLIPNAEQQALHAFTPQQLENHKHLLLAVLMHCSRFSVSGELEPEERYDLDKFLGSGASGLVLRGTRKRDGAKVAVKLIAESSSSTHAKFHRELSTLTAMNHENVLPCWDAFSCPPSCVPSLSGVDTTSPGTPPSKAGVTSQKNLVVHVPRVFVIVAPYMDACLFDLIDQHKSGTGSTISSDSASVGGLPLDIVKPVFTQLALGLQYMHARGFVHGDIKDENALVEVVNGGRVLARLCDFGHTRWVPRESNPTVVCPSKLVLCDVPECPYAISGKNGGFLETDVLNPQGNRNHPYALYGTTVMTPPEMHHNVRLKAWFRQQQQQHQLQQQAAGETSAAVPALPSGATPQYSGFGGFEADVWALGLLLHTMVFGELPAECYALESDYTTGVTKTPKAGRRGRRKAVADGAEDEAEEAKAKKAGTCGVRIGGKGKKVGAVDRRLRDLLRKMLARDAEKRLRMEEVLGHAWVVG